MRGRRLLAKEGQGCFNLPLDTAQPPSLETLWLSSDFNQPLYGVAWPNGMLPLGLTFFLDGYRYIDSVSFPASVRNLLLVEKSKREMRLPNGVQISTLTIFSELSDWDSDHCDYEPCYTSMGDYDGCCCYRRIGD